MNEKFWILERADGTPMGDFSHYHAGDDRLPDWSSAEEDSEWVDTPIEYVAKQVQVVNEIRRTLPEKDEEDE